MFLHLCSHSDAFRLASMLIPGAIWVAADGDVGQCEDDDVALEDKETEAVIVLHADGTAQFSMHRLLCVKTYLQGKEPADQVPEV